MTGVDWHDQPGYPYEFHHAYAETFPLGGFDAYHASPPCQSHTRLASFSKGYEWPDYLDLIRERLAATGKPYVIENVPGAPLVSPVMLCGRTFGLKLYRHRNFETNWPLPEPVHLQHEYLAARQGYLPTADKPFMTIAGRYGHYSKAWVRTAAEYMDVPWADADLNGVCEAIPPAYTRYVGTELLRYLTTS